MTADPESLFRAAEHRLDELLRRDEAVIRARGIEISDTSARFYHYKNDLLSWSFDFRSRKQRGSEYESVWVIVSTDELDTAEVRVWTRAELFQIGKFSRWEFTTEERMPLTCAEDIGLGNIVLRAISAGEAAAGEVV